MADCFTDTPDLSAYTAVPNRIALDDMNAPTRSQIGKARQLTEQSLALDWSETDRADAQTLNRILWHTIQGVNTPYPVF